MTDATLRTALRTYVQQDLGATGPIDDDADLFATGLIKSMQLMELINHLEDTYAVRVEQRDVFGGSLRSLASIAQLVLARGNAS